MPPLREQRHVQGLALFGVARDDDVDRAASHRVRQRLTKAPGQDRMANDGLLDEVLLGPGLNRP
jgi:hypothetical protein